MSSSTWKFWGGGGTKKTKNENATTTTTKTTTTSSTATTEDKTPSDTTVPPSGQQQQRDRKDRNMSISRSGRHKFRNKQRCSVLRDDLYNDDGIKVPSDTSTDSPQGACQQAERNSLTRLRGSLVMASQPTAV